MTARPKRGPIPSRWMVQAIGPDGWVVAERSVDRPNRMLLEDVAEQLRALVRSETGWTPRLRVLDSGGHDVSAASGLE
jgi:hypothetical protein